ncbi:MAG: hypothetical protein ABJE95_07710 [Byssovorax sp.]
MKRRGFLSSNALLRAALGLSVLAASLTAGRGASAQTKQELDDARKQFQEGMALSAANNCSAALTKFRAVANVKMTANVAFNIAECEERLGKLVSALGNYRLAASQAQGDPKAKDVASRVADRIDALDARIPKLTIKRGRGADVASIELDGSELGAAQLSAATPVDPGSHTVVAKIGDRVYAQDKVILVEKENKTFEVKINAPVAKIEKDQVVEPDPQPEKPAALPPKSKVPAVVAIGVGGVGVILGVTFMVIRGGALSDLDAKCGGDTSCPPSAQPSADKGRLFTGLAEGAFLVGAAGIVTGVVLLATGGPPKPKPAPAAAFLGAAPSARGVHLITSAPGASIGGLSLAGSF